MFNVCPTCGLYDAAKIIDPGGPFAICPHCGHAHRFVRLPLAVVSGPSGAGKSTVCLALAATLDACICLETDILWGALPATPEDNYRSYHEAWLRLAKNIAQAGRPVALFGSATPAQIEACDERRYFSAVRYLALVCDDDEALRERLRARPAWRNASDSEWIEQMVAFNRWFKTHAAARAPTITLLATDAQSPAETIAQVAQWLRAEAFAPEP
jgi:predicted kinase